MKNLLTKGAIAETPHKRRLFHSLQKGWNFRTRDRLEFPEQVRGKLSFSDGKHSLFKVSTSKGRLYDHPGSERRLFVSSSPQGLSKVPSIPLEKQMLRLQGLWFGLNTAPRIFTKLLKPVAALLLKGGVRMVLYLDDFLILGSTFQEAQSHSAMAVSLLESLGFAVNLEKSCLVPTQILTFLGFVIDSTVEALSLPQ